MKEEGGKMMMQEELVFGGNLNSRQMETKVFYSCLRSELNLRATCAKPYGLLR